MSSVSAGLGWASNQLLQLVKVKPAAGSPGHPAGLHMHSLGVEGCVWRRRRAQEAEARDENDLAVGIADIARQK